MFARLKESTDGKRVYVQIVANVREARHPYEREKKTRQRVIATLGRVDHLDPAVQRWTAENLTLAISELRVTRRPARQEA